MITLAIIAFTISIVVLLDAKNIGVREGLITGMCNIGPWGWFFATWISWPIGLVFYLLYRPKLKAAIAAAEASQIVEPVRSASAFKGLEKLGALRDKGILTEEEFAAQKKRILDLSGGSTVATPDVISTAGSIDLGAALLAVPVVGTVLVWFWIANMNLLQSPRNSLSLLVVATVCITALLAAVEASKVGATADRKKGTYSPIQWFFITALLWIVGYPAYLLKRKTYGLKNYLWAGIAVMAIFLSSVIVIQSAIDSKINEVRRDLGMAPNDSHSLFSEFIAFFVKSPEKKAKEAADVERKVVSLLTQSDNLKLAVAEFYAGNGNMPESCSKLPSACTSAYKLGAGGAVIVNLSAVGAAPLAEKSVIQVPSLNEQGDISWACTTDADYQLIPSACRHTLAKLPATTTEAVPAATVAAAVAASPEPERATPTKIPPLTATDATAPALAGATGNAAQAIGTASLASLDSAQESVRSFYLALGRGDGVTANSFMALEKRASPAYQPDAIEAFYGHMAEPLTLVSVSAAGANEYEVRYRYRKQSAVCNGHAIVTTEDSGNRALIARIRPIGNC